MKEVYLISENNVRNRTNISSNINSKFLLSAIKEAQLEYECLIGTKLYNKLLNLVDNDSIKDEENTWYKELLDKSQTYLSYMTLVRVIPLCNYHIDNFGITTQKDEHIDSLSTKDMFQLVDYYEKEADSLKSRLQKYLILNYKEFPELVSDKINEIKAELYSAASTTIFLGGNRGKKYNGYGIYSGGKLERKYEYTNYKITNITLI